MLNAAERVTATIAPAIDYADASVAERMASGRMNTDDATILENIASAIRRGHPQMRPWPPRTERICLVGSGPSLTDTENELRELIWNGATLVTMNAGYHWCIQHGLRPNTQIVMDARPSNARFLEPAVPKCNYVLASQCAPAVFNAVDGRSDVWIFQAVMREEGPATDLLDAFYAGQWVGVGGGTSVATRAINLLAMTGYKRFDLFGVDCCWIGAQHHVLPQPENVKDQCVAVTMSAQGRPETARVFRVASWMLKQFEDCLTIMKVNGHHFTLAVHGDGMLAYAIRTLGADDLDQLSLTASELTGDTAHGRSSV